MEARRLCVWCRIGSVHIREFRASRGRRSALSATARLLGWCVAFGLTLSVSSVLAGPNGMRRRHACRLDRSRADGPGRCRGEPSSSREMAEAGSRGHEEWQSRPGGVLHRAGGEAERQAGSAARRRSRTRRPRRARIWKRCSPRTGKPKSTASGPLSKLFNKDSGARVTDRRRIRTPASRPATGRRRAGTPAPHGDPGATDPPDAVAQHGLGQRDEPAATRCHAVAGRHGRQQPSTAQRRTAA